MPSETSVQRPTKPTQVGAPPPEPEHLRCPRCDSTNTKFCYYNNYNFSQPRHFCKACRRYWTHGGTLRDIPVGGGTRKSAKRSRSSSSSSLFSDHEYRHMPTPTTPFFLPLSNGDHNGVSVPFVNNGKPCYNNMAGSFTSLLGTQAPGLLSLNGFGLGLGSHGFEDVGFGLGRNVWAFPPVGPGGVTESVGGNTWQVESGENGFTNVDTTFSLPDLAISTPGNAMK
ncbi:hypothetical protein DCAR_0312415 [Daucus carota subsp. sativus]|uniref:Dof zinc finger protein n=1 Tax=Daucus carota subsp. sativus TaxID=79200 RepID=A0A166B0A7_DAUCS|nr:PREDICTED: dof zinc finger protein DOF3.4-like [Daucus carota subsp. sativus]WOG93134.1 hypothetical protein DCAR_0312415 [Daucus carota subsp. sativus]